jgi:hypothetical protein
MVQKNPEVTVTNCCENGKLFGIWALLSAFDEAELSVQKQTAQNASESYNHPIAGKGTGYSTGRAAFPFNWRSLSDPYSTSHLSFSQQVGNDETEDKFKIDVLKMLPPFLPSSISKPPQPAPELFAMFRLSLLIDCTAALLRNDSVTDMTKRKDLYHALFAFLTTVAKYPPIVSILLEQRLTKKRTPGLQALGEEGNGKALIIDVSSAGLAPSLVSCGQETRKHAKAFAGLTSNKAIMTDIESGSNKETIALCKELLWFYETVKTVAPSAMKAIASVSRDTWTTYTEENRVTFTDDVLEVHRFQREFWTLQESPRGRIAFLWKELTTLISSL